jgi:hypothetical protein
MTPVKASSDEGSKASSSSSDSSEAWPWKSPDWRAVQEQGAAAGESRRCSLENTRFIVVLIAGLNWHCLITLLASCEVPQLPNKTKPAPGNARPRKTSHNQQSAAAAMMKAKLLAMNF